MTAAGDATLHHADGEGPDRSLRVALIDPSLFTIPYDAKLAGALSGLGHDVTVYGEARDVGDSFSRSGSVRGLFYAELVALGSHRWPRPAVRIAKGAFHWRGLRRLIDDFRRHRPDIIHFQWTPLPLVDRLFLPALRRIAPVVITAHDSRPFNGAAWSLQKWGATRILRDFDGIVVHTHEAVIRLTNHGIAPSRIVRIPHGVLHDAEVAPVRVPPVSDRVRFLLFGKLKPYKGADVLIEAFRQLPPDLQNRAEVLIAGEPHMDAEPLRLAAQAIGGGIRFDLRFVPDDEMAELLAAADVIVFPYREIDVSGVLMAVLRYGKPIIASRIGGFAELLIDGRHGVLVAPGDARELSRAMARLCTEADTRSAMGHAVAALGAEIPTWDEIARRTTAFYLARLRTG